MSRPTLYYLEGKGLCDKETEGANEYVRVDVMWWHLTTSVLPKVNGLSSNWVEVYAEGMKYPVMAYITRDGGWEGTDYKPLRFTPKWWRPILLPSGYISSMNGGDRRR